MPSPIRVYAACLAAYNAGKLHGAWIDAAQDADTIQEEIDAMLAKSPVSGAEEYAIHDYEGFHGLKLGESESPEHIAELAALLSEHGEAYALYVANVGLKHATPEDFQDSYQGAFEDDEEFAHSLLDDSAESVPDFFRNHIDWESVARELMMDGYYSIRSGSVVHVFSNT